MDSDDSYLILRLWQNSLFQDPFLSANKQFEAKALKQVLRTLLWVGLSHIGVAFT